MDEEEIIEETARSNGKRRRSRIMVVESSSDDSSNATDNNDLTTISIQADSIVVMAGSNASDEEIVEGKKFATTYLTPDDNEVETGDKKIIEKEATEAKSIETTVENEQNRSESLIEDDDIANASKPEASDPTENLDSSEAVVSESVVVPENDAQSTSVNIVEENVPESPVKSDADVVAIENKEKELPKEKILSKKQRTSLPGIDRLPLKLSKKHNRMSLGELSSNHQNVRGEAIDEQSLAKSKSLSSKFKLLDEDDIDSTADTTLATDHAHAQIDDRKESVNSSTSSIENHSSSHLNASTLNASSQEEENNNRKDSAKNGKCC